MKQQAQAILEFSFTMVLLILLIYGVVQVVHWTLITTAEESNQMGALHGNPTTWTMNDASMSVAVTPLDMIWQNKETVVKEKEKSKKK